VTLDPRLHACREDLADARLRGHVRAARYVEGWPARIVAGVAAVRRRPAGEAETVTCFHYGEPVRVFDTARGYAWCQSLQDCYVGYVETGRLAFGAAPAPTHFVATLGSYRYATPDLRAPVIDFLPRHSALVVTETGILTRGAEYARLDSGGFLPLACLSPQPPRSPDIVAAAEPYLGCPYRWGGRSFLGIDCSGLVQSAFRDLGIAVPRDTDMQRDAIGLPAAVCHAAELRRNDLIYLPGHVLIYAGKGAVIHADGASMIVRRDDLAGLMRQRGWRFAEFTVRRL
jgi:cell wall-associated NlpC family hydrolase